MCLSPTPGSILPTLVYINRAEWLSQNTILYFQSETGWRFGNQTGFWSHRNENLCRGMCKRHFFQRWNKVSVLWSTCIVMIHPASVMFHTGWRCSCSSDGQARSIKSVSTEPSHIYIFSHLTVALEGQRSAFGNWKRSWTPALWRTRTISAKMGNKMELMSPLFRGRLRVCVNNPRRWKCCCSEVSFDKSSSPAQQAANVEIDTMKITRVNNTGEDMAMQKTHTLKNEQ